MPQHVCNGATLVCTFGTGPSTFVVMPKNKVMTSNQPAANIMDNIPNTNIMPFPMCISPSNPAFVSATAAALGTPTPVPCTPATPAPWTPGATTVMLANQPSLDNISMLTCTLGGMISITVPGQTTEMIP